MQFGNNLIGIPSNLPDTNIGISFPNVDENLVAIQGEGNACAWDANATAWVGSLTNIDPLKGYWFVTAEDLNLTLNGSFMPNPTYSLHYGGNLISYPGHNSMEVGEAIPSELYTSGKLYAIIGEGIACQYFSEPHNTWMGSLSRLEPGKGYWFLANDASNFQFNLETVAGCTNIEYGTEAGCTGAGYDWIQLLGPGS